MQPKGAIKAREGKEMENPGLWRLFFLTGLPEAWLALRGEAEEQEEPAVMAFGPQEAEEQEC